MPLSSLCFHANLSWMDWKTLLQTFEFDFSKLRTKVIRNYTKHTVSELFDFEAVNIIGFYAIIEMFWVDSLY